MNRHITRWILSSCMFLMFFGDARGDDKVIRGLEVVKAKILRNDLQGAVRNLNLIGHEDLMYVYLNIINSYDFLENGGSTQIPFERDSHRLQNLTECDVSLNNECRAALWYYELAYSRYLVCNPGASKDSLKFNTNTPFGQLSSAFNTQHFGRSTAIRILEDNGKFKNGEKQNSANLVHLIDRLQKIMLPAAYWILKFRHSHPVLANRGSKRKKSVERSRIGRCLVDWASRYAIRRNADNLKGFEGFDGMTYGYVYLYLDGTTSALSSSRGETQTYQTMSKLIAEKPVDADAGKRIVAIFCKLGFPFAYSSELKKSAAFKACMRHYL